MCDAVILQSKASIVSLDSSQISMCEEVITLKIFICYKTWKMFDYMNDIHLNLTEIPRLLCAALLDDIYENYEKFLCFM